VGEIVDAAMAVLARGTGLAGQTVLVTAGPTVEDIDPVRYISNRSSGRMGYRVAEAARDRGARVILVSGPTSLAEPWGVEVVKVRSADEMARAVKERVAGAHLLVMAAAVADYRPEAPSAAKIKKTADRIDLSLVRTPDILEAIRPVNIKGSCFVVGFAAETENLRENAGRKRAAKGMDLIVANDVGRPDAGFDGETNAALLIDAGGDVETPLVSKRQLADRILDRVAELRTGTSVAPSSRGQPS
jgi:phosphopantothenoylcysteine decarboxylase / phosphopantothenate---cysteine ligase